MRRSARTDLCGGRSAMVVPTATPVSESNCHTPGRMSVAVLHRLGCTKHFVLNANAFVLWSSRKDEGNTATATDGFPVRPNEQTIRQTTQTSVEPFLNPH